MSTASPRGQLWGAYYEVPSSPQYSSLHSILEKLVADGMMSVVLGSVRNVVGVVWMTIGLVTKGISVLEGHGPNQVEVSATVVP